MSNSILINGKFAKQRITGVQRYAQGISSFIKQVEFTVPASQNPIEQLIWEQLFLPLKAWKQQKLLINFCNTAPFWFKNQIVTIHDMAVFENPNWFQPLFATYYQRLLRKLGKNAKHIVTVSEFSKGEIIKHLKVTPSKISVIHSALKDDWNLLKPIKIKELDGKKYLLMVGSHDPRKNFSFVIDHLNEWLENHQTELIIVGNPGKAFRSQKTNERKNVKWLTQIEDGQLKWLYQNAQTVIHPSLYEGFSLVPLEAISLNVNCLISDIPVHREIIGPRAHYFELQKPESLIHNLELALNQPIVSLDSLPYSFESSTKKWQLLIDQLT